MLFQKYKYRELTVKDAEEALLLFAYSCRYDDYYTKFFGKPSVELDILQAYPKDIENILSLGHTIGCFHKNKLVGMVLSFGLLDWKNNHLPEYEHFFFGEDRSDDDGDVWVNLLVNYLHTRSESVLYVPVVCVKDEYRCQGIAKSLIKQLCNKFKNRYALVSDATHSMAMPMWLSNGFRELKLDNTVKVVIK